MSIDMRLVRFLGLVLLLSLSVLAQADYTVSATTGNVLLTPDHGENGSAWGNAHCENCHVLKLIHAKAPLIRPIVKAKGYPTCGGCHGDNGTGQPRPCLTCHNSGDLPLKPLQSGVHAHDFSVKQERALTDGDCLLCHIKSDMDGRFERNVDLTPIRDDHGRITPYNRQSDFCLRCHNQDHQPRGVAIHPRPDYGLNDPLIAIETDYLAIDRHGTVAGGNGLYTGLRGKGYHYDQFVECTDCHVMHGTRNDKLILDDSRKGVKLLDPALRLRPYKVRVRQGHYAELCVLCHRMDNPTVEQGILDAGNGLSGVHDVNSDCTECHTHGQLFGGGL